MHPLQSLWAYYKEVIGAPPTFFRSTDKVSGPPSSKHHDRPSSSWQIVGKRGKSISTLVLEPEVAEPIALIQMLGRLLLHSELGYPSCLDGHKYHLDQSC